MKRSRDSIIKKANSLNLKCDFIKWQEWEDNIIKKHYPIEGAKCVEHINKIWGYNNRSKATVRDRANHLNLKYGFMDWQPWEDDIIKTYYQTDGPKVCMVRINSKWGNNKRSKGAVQKRAEVLNIKVSNLFWQEWEDDIIKTYYPIKGTKCVKEINDKWGYNNRNKNAVRSRAGVLNIQIIGWQEWEDNTIKTYYPIEGPKGCMIRINAEWRCDKRSKGAVKKRAQILHIKNKPANYWTEEEDNIIKEYYPIEGSECYKRLPGRSKESLKTRARTLHIKTISAPKDWTDEEIKVLKKYYPTEGSSVIKRLPGRSEGSIRVEVSKLDLKYVGEHRWKTSKKVRCIDTNEVFESAKVAGEIKNVEPKNILAVCNKKRNTAGGYHWEFVVDNED